MSRESGPETGSTAARILDAAESLFAQRGFAGASVREIAGQVGLNQASIYNHFPSKQALYEAVLERGFRPMRELLDAAARIPFSPQAADRLAEQLVDHLWRTPHFPKLVQRELLDDGEYLERMTEQWLRPVYEQGRRAIEASPARTSWREEELPLLIIGLYHLLFGHFTAAPLMERVIGVDPFSETMRRAHVEFLKRAGRRLLAIEPG